MKNLNELCLLQDYIEFTSILKKLHSTYNWFSLKTPKGSITNTELFFIFRHIKKINPQIIFESGFFKGRSSIVLGEIMKEIGHVYCARFNYPEENYDTFEFENDYKNIHIIDQKGEDAIKTIDKSLKLIAVIDGPKPVGYLYNRPGWIELMDELIQFDNLHCVFQHDISDERNKIKFINYYHSNMNRLFDYYFINNDFIKKFIMFGNEDETKNSLLNLGFIIKKT